MRKYPTKYQFNITILMRRVDDLHGDRGGTIARSDIDEEIPVEVRDLVVEIREAYQQANEGRLMEIFTELANSADENIDNTAGMWNQDIGTLLIDCIHVFSTQEAVGTLLRYMCGLCEYHSEPAILFAQTDLMSILCGAIPSPDYTVFFYGLRMMINMIRVIPDTEPIPFTIVQLCDLCKGFVENQTTKELLVEMMQLVYTVLMYRPISVIRDLDHIIDGISVICQEGNVPSEVLEIVARIMKVFLESGQANELRMKFQKMNELMHMFNRLIRDMSDPLVDTPCITPYIKMLAHSLNLTSIPRDLVFNKLRAIGYERIVDLACNMNDDISRYALEIIIQVLRDEDVTQSQARRDSMHTAVQSKDLIKSIVPEFEKSTKKRKIVMAHVIAKAMSYDCTNAFNDAMDSDYLSCVASLAGDAIDDRVVSAVVKTLCIMIETADSIGMLPAFYDEYTEKGISDIIMEIQEREDEISNEMAYELSEFDKMENEMRERLGIEDD